jgi:two-component system response regulator FixJ
VRGLNETLSVYVIDDDDAVRDSLAALLEPEGFVVKLFSSADAFLEGLGKSHLEDGGPACLLLDLHMPGKGGQELLEILVARESRIPVVVMTGNADVKSRSRALGTGAVAFLEKPVDADILIDTIKASQQ